MESGQSHISGLSPAVVTCIRNNLVIVRHVYIDGPRLRPGKKSVHRSRLRPKRSLASHMQSRDRARAMGKTSQA